MSDQTRDVNPGHLFPPFLLKVQMILNEVNEGLIASRSSLRFAIWEGFRSQSRQNWLYEQGRTRRGDVVTWLRVSRHTSGLAADLVPLNQVGAPVWNALPEVWKELREAAHRHGLESGQDWINEQDMPHIEVTGRERQSWTPLARSYLRERDLVGRI